MLYLPSICFSFSSTQAIHHSLCHYIACCCFFSVEYFLSFFLYFFSALYLVFVSDNKRHTLNASINVSRLATNTVPSSSFVLDYSFFCFFFSLFGDIVDGGDSVALLSYSLLYFYSLWMGIASLHCLYIQIVAGSCISHSLRDFVSILRFRHLQPPYAIKIPKICKSFLFFCVPSSSFPYGKSLHHKIPYCCQQYTLLRSVGWKFGQTKRIQDI